VDDGGYYLLGLSEPKQELFCDISWGSEKVFQQTVSKLSGGSYETLPEWYDVDVENDLRKLAKDLEVPFKGFPRRTAVLLNKWKIRI
jgi:glycosyltransferase A (GT-A) superfamily protein (DUF2064 family)